MYVQHIRIFQQSDVFQAGKIKYISHRCTGSVYTLRVKTISFEFIFRNFETVNFNPIGFILLAIS
jgi:hypothetical protein